MTDQMTHAEAVSVIAEKVAEIERLQTELAELRKAQGEPVAVANKGIMSDGFTMTVFDAEKVPEGTKLYTSAPTIPEGYVLVPVEPTAKMIAEFWDEALEIRMIRTSGYSRDAETILHAAYKAAIAAAPKPTKDAA